MIAIALMALAALAAIGAAVVVGTRSDEPQRTDTGGVATDTWHPKYPPQRDVELEDCEIERTGAIVGGTARNPMDEPADYLIEVHLVDPSGATITSAAPTVADVAPKSTTAWTGRLPAVPSTAQSATCKVVKVNRYAGG